MRNLSLIIKEDLKNLLKNPMWIFYATLFPVLLVIILGFLSKNSYGSDVTSFDYYGITLMIYSILTSGMTSANSFMEERIKKPNMRIIFAPGNIKSVYLSKIIASFIFAFTFHILDMLFLCIVFKIHITAIVHILVLMGLLEFCAVSLGIMFCCIFKTEAMANQILSIVINLFAIFGGLLFSLDGYGKVIRTISYISPAKWLSVTVFRMIYDNDFALFIPVVIVLILLNFAILAVCGKTFRKEDCIC